MKNEFVVLRSIETGDVFWSRCTCHNPERSASGRVTYEILAYADTPEEAQRIWIEKSPMGCIAAIMDGLIKNAK